MAHHTFPGLVQSYSIMAQCELSLSRPESFDQLRCNLPQQLASSPKSTPPEHKSNQALRARFLPSSTGNVTKSRSFFLIKFTVHMLIWKKKEEKESCVLTRDFTLACTIVLLKIKGVSCWSSKCYGSLVLDLVRDGTCLLVGGVDRTASSRRPVVVVVPARQKEGTTTCMSIPRPCVHMRR